MSEIARVIKGTYNGPDLAVNGFALHTDLLKEGFIYVALKGEKADGHQYIEEAKKRGAIGAIVTQDIQGNFPTIKVSDALNALITLAHYQRKRLKKTTFIAVTGSAGKTSTKELLVLLLKKYGTVYGSIKSYNTIYGMPICLLNCPLDTTYAVFELGMNAPGEIRHMTKILHPHAAMIVSIGPAHIGFFKNIEEIALAKAEILEGLPEKGIAVIHDNQEVHKVLEQRVSQYPFLKIRWFGENPNSTGFLEEYVKGHATARIAEKYFSFSMLGKHFALNALGALTLIDALGLSLEPSLKELSSFSPLPGRGMIEKLPWQNGYITLIDESYNANPLSVKAGLEQLEDITGDRKYVVLSEMKELGEHSDKLHLSLKEHLLKTSGVITYGGALKPLYESLPKSLRIFHGSSAQDVIPILNNILQDGDVLFLKGSFTTQMGLIVDWLKK